MSTNKRKRSKSRGTRSTGKIAESGPKKQSKGSTRSALRWINSGDLRLIPDEVLAKTSNKELDPQAFRLAAAAQTDSPMYGAVYGLDDVGVIQSAVLIRASRVDNCLYVENLFGANLKDPALLERLKDEKDRLQAKAVKLVKDEKMSTGG